MALLGISLSVLTAIVAVWKVGGTRFGRWIAAWCVAGALGNLGHLVLAMQGVNNHWLGHLYMLAATLSVAAAASVAFRAVPRWRRAALAAAGIVVVVWAVSVFDTDALSSFPAVSGPLFNLYASLFGIGLVMLSLRDSTLSPAINALAWTGTAFVVTHLPTMLMNPISALLLSAEDDKILWVLTASMVLEMVGMVILLVAFTRREIVWTA